MRRIQRKRTKGWRMPANAIYVGRPTKWGNPLQLGCRLGWDNRIFIGTTRADCVAFYRRWIQWQFTPDEIQAELGGKDLACWCPLDQPCHADVLIELCGAVTE